jgi:hypothetical protein
LNAGNLAGPFGFLVTGHIWGTITSGAHLTSPFHATASWRSFGQPFKVPAGAEMSILDFSLA